MNLVLIINVRYELAMLVVRLDQILNRSENIFSALSGMTWQRLSDIFAMIYWNHMV